MNRISLIIKQRVFGIIFIVIAVIGGIFIFWYISNLKARISEGTGYKEIFVAGTNVKKGEEVTEELIKIQKIPENIFSEKFVIEKNNILGRKVAENISEGEIITIDKLEGMESGEDLNPGFSSYIPYQLRAVSIPVNFYGDKSLIRPGDRIDIISTCYEPESGAIYSYTVLSEKEVVLIRSDLEGSFSGEKNGSGDLLADSIFDSSSVDPGYTNLLIMTFYLDALEVEEVFLALEKGVLNLSICSGSYSRSR